MWVWLSSCIGRTVSYCCADFLQILEDPAECRRQLLTTSFSPQITFTMSTTTMKALNYLGPYQVRVEDVEKPRMEHPDDIIVKVTTVNDVNPDNVIQKKTKLTQYQGCNLRL